MRDGKPSNMPTVISRCSSCALLYRYAACSKAKQPPPKIVPVVAEMADQKNIPLQLKTIGNVEAFNAVSIKALVGGEMWKACTFGKDRM